MRLALALSGIGMEPNVLTYGFVERDRERIVALLREYEEAIGVSLCFQNFGRELAELPGAYALPRGQMIFARQPNSDELVGCVALRPVSGKPGQCEMKRLYVRAAARGSGLGRTLALAAINEAHRLGYARMCLDTLPSMTAAQALYRDLGFRHMGAAASEPPVLLFERALGNGP
jgi:ribosomal protein S18 acetylase RimI-like enzyme